MLQQVHYTSAYSFFTKDRNMKINATSMPQDETKPINFTTLKDLMKGKISEQMHAFTSILF